MSFRIDVTGRFDATKRTPQGGLKLPAYVTRTGVLSYRQPDGSMVRELRHPDEVFNADSMDSLAGAPVTVGHPGRVTPDVWKMHTVGHVGDTVAQKEKFVSTTLRVQDAKAVKAVEEGNLLELSCGYNCDMDPTPGEFEGEKYDAIQRNIRYDHVALLPVNGGRAGNDVRIRFDGYTETPKLQSMTPEELAQHKADLAKARSDAADAKAACDKATAERDALAVQVKDLSDPARMDAAVAKAVKLHTDAAVVLGSADLSGKSARTIMTEAVSKTDSTFKADGLSDDYLQARFDMAVASTKTGAKSIETVRTVAAETQEAPAKDLIAEAKARFDAASANAWKVKK